MLSTVPISARLCPLSGITYHKPSHLAIVEFNLSEAPPSNHGFRDTDARRHRLSRIRQRKLFVVILGYVVVSADCVFVRCRAVLPLSRCYGPRRRRLRGVALVAARVVLPGPGFRRLRRFRRRGQYWQRVCGRVRQRRGWERSPVVQGPGGNDFARHLVLAAVTIGASIGPPRWLRRLAAHSETSG